jgi:hypothetical protein
MPYRFEPRDYQKNLFSMFRAGYNRGLAVWHRRAGKDKTLLNMVTLQACTQLGTYYYLFPSYKQGKKVLWLGQDKEGMPFLDHFPPNVVAKKNETDMRIELINGSSFQIIGTDNWDSLMGTNPKGCVFSEYALQDPRAWEYIRPILLENNGWAIFNSTPRGHNHFFELYNDAKKSRHWFTEKLTIEDTGVMTREDVEREIADGMDPETARQEFYCDFDAAVRGAYFSKNVREARKAGRICRVPIERGVPVHTWWDLGMNDRNSIIMQQDVGREVHIVGYHEDSGVGFPEYVRELEKFADDNEVKFGRHHLPHDGNVRELGTGKTRKQELYDLGLRNIKTYRKRKSVIEGINPTRKFFTKCWFSTQNGVPLLVKSLVSYHAVYDEERKVTKLRPVHDWSSHGADAFQVMAMNHNFRNTRRSMTPSDQYNRAPSALGWA